VTAPLDTSTFLLILCAALIIAMIWIVRLEIRLHRLMRGKGGGDLESLISAHSKSLADAEEFQREMEKYLARVEKRLRRAVQGIKTIRFNPFKGTGEGGFQSFASAFLNEEGDGMVISTLWSRDRMSVFGKPIQKGTSTFELTEEEQTAIKDARDYLEDK
jgi:hypothetical protein